MTEIRQEISELDKQILELTEKKVNLYAKIEDDKLEEFKKLEWTKDCLALVQYTSMGGIGFADYQIKLSNAPKFYGTNRHITIAGDQNSCCYQNLVYKSGDFEDFACFETSNVDLLIELLGKVKFKKLEYPKNLFRVLEAVAKKAAEDNV